MGSFYLLSINNISDNLKYFMSIFVFLLVFSLSFFYYMLPTSDNNRFTAFNEVFYLEDKDSLPDTIRYFEWPIFFIFNKVALLLTGLEVRIFSFIFYGILGILISSFVYNYINKKGFNGYIGTSIFLPKFYDHPTNRRQMLLVVENSTSTHNSSGKNRFYFAEGR